MKRLFNILMGLLVMVLLIPTAGLAQWQNEMGIYTADMASNCSSENLVTNTMILVITNPYNVDEGRPVEWIHGYECFIELEGTGLVLAVRWPVDALNVGNNSNHIVQFGFTDAQVIDQAVAIAEIDVLYFDSTLGPLTLTLKPANPTSVPGQMAFLDSDAQDDGIIPMMTVSGDWNSPVFAINADPEIVATDQSSFDNIKAMYR